MHIAQGQSTISFSAQGTALGPQPAPSLWTQDLAVVLGPQLL